MLILPCCYANIGLLLCVYYHVVIDILVRCRVKNNVTPWYKFDDPRVVIPHRYGQGILTDIPHPIILSNIIGQWGAMFHMKHEH